VKKEFKGQAYMPSGIGYKRKSGGDDGDTTGSERIVTQIDSENLDDAGFQTDGFHVKKGTAFQVGASIDYVNSRPLNRLPPGMFIDNQDHADIRTMPYKEIVDAQGYPGDGWQGKSNPLGK
jgi:hypothetical protein